MWTSSSGSSACFRLALLALLGSALRPFAVAEAGKLSNAHLPDAATGGPEALKSQEPLAQELQGLKQRIFSLENEVGDLRSQLSSCRAGEDEMGWQHLLAFPSWRSSIWILLPLFFVFAIVYRPRRQVAPNLLLAAAEARESKQRLEAADAKSPNSNNGKSKECREFTSRIEKRYTPHRDGSSKASSSGESQSHHPQSEVSSDGERIGPCWGSRHFLSEVNKFSQLPMFQPPPGLPPPENLTTAGLRPMSPPPGLAFPAGIGPADIYSSPAAFAAPMLVESQLDLYALAALSLPATPMLSAPAASMPAGSLSGESWSEADDPGSGNAEKRRQTEEAVECNGTEVVTVNAARQEANGPCSAEPPVPECCHSAVTSDAPAVQVEVERRVGREHAPSSRCEEEPTVSSLISQSLARAHAAAAQKEKERQLVKEQVRATPSDAKADGASRSHSSMAKSPAAPDTAQEEEKPPDAAANGEKNHSAALEEEVSTGPSGTESSVNSHTCRATSTASPSRAAEAEQKHQVFKASTRWKDPAPSTPPRNGLSDVRDTGAMRRNAWKSWGICTTYGHTVLAAPGVVARCCSDFLSSGWHIATRKGTPRCSSGTSLKLEAVERKSSETRAKVRSSAVSTSQAPVAATGTTATSAGVRTGKHSRAKGAHGAEGRSSSASEGRNLALTELTERLRRLAQENAGYVANLIRSPVFLVTAIMLVLVLVGKVHHREGPDNRPLSARPSRSAEGPRVGDTDIPESACSFDEPLPHLRETQQPEETIDGKPRVVFYGPCILKVHKAVARKYRPSAIWYYVKNPLTKVELKHRYEGPLVLPGMQDNATIVKFLLNNILPRFGEVTATTYEWYLAAGKGMIWMLVDPASDGSMEGNLQKHRPVMLEVAAQLMETYQVFWINTNEHQLWLETWLSLTSYPAVVVQEEAADAERFTWTGDITTSNILRFVEEIERGAAIPDRHISPSLDGLVVPGSQDTLTKCSEEAPRWFGKGVRRRSARQTCMPVTLHSNYPESDQFR